MVSLGLAAVVVVVVFFLLTLPQFTLIRGACISMTELQKNRFLKFL